MILIQSEQDILRTIRNRQSARAFSSEPVSHAAIARILEAGRHAPSGANQQPWHFVVIIDPVPKREIRVACERVEARLHGFPPEPLGNWMKEHSITQEKVFLENAPVLIAAFFDPKAPYAIPSVWLAIGFILLQAEEEGLSSLPYTPAGAELNSILSVPEALRLAAILPIGKGIVGKRQPRKPLTEVASLHSFGALFNQTPVS